MAQRVIRAFAAAAAAAVVSLPVFAQQGGGAERTAAPTSFAQVAATAPSADVLMEGDAAPSLAGISWLKGDAVSKFESGRVYIVEVWATWCGPCKRGIPHLTALQAKHKDRLTVIGISCWERADTAEARVELARSFVESQGAAMEYTVAADGDGVIVKNWMQPAGRRSIPTAFIVDGQGNIAWIGNPLTGMDAVLEKVMAGGFDAKAEAAKAKIAAAAKKVKDEMFARANLLANSGDHAGSLKLLEQLLESETDAAARVPIIRQKLRVLLKSDEAGAYAYAKAAAEGELKDNDYGLHMLATSIMAAEGLKQPDDALVVAIAARAAELAAPNNSAVHETLGQARFRAGDVAGAIAAAEKALEVMKLPEARANAAAVARVQKQVEEYRAGAK